MKYDVEKFKKNKKDKPSITNLADDFTSEKLLKNNIYPLLVEGVYYLWSGQKYVVCHDLEQRIRNFLIERKVAVTNSLVSNVISAVKHKGWSLDYTSHTMPYYRGFQWFSDTKNVVAFNNGLLDMDAVDLGLHAHSHDWCSPYCLPFDYDPSAQCPRWLAFLHEVFEGDDERIALLAEFMGYCMVWDISFQKALLLIGQPRSGKGTILKVIASLVGRDHYTGFAIDSLTERFGLNQLRGKLVAGVGELELAGSSNKMKIVEKLKSITGGDEMAIEEKYNPMITSEQIFARFVISSNTMPSLKDASGALMSRLLMLKFNKSFKDKEDLFLFDKLSKEISGIANWALAGLRRLRQNGKFTKSKTSESLFQQIMGNSATVLAFAQDALMIAPSLNPGWAPSGQLCGEDVFMMSSALYQIYCDWCVEHDFKCADTRYFFQDLKHVVNLGERRQKTIETAQKWGYYGITTKKQFAVDSIVHHQDQF